MEQSTPKRGEQGEGKEGNRLCEPHRHKHTQVKGSAWLLTALLSYNYKNFLPWEHCQVVRRSKAVLKPESRDQQSPWNPHSSRETHSPLRWTGNSSPTAWPGRDCQRTSGFKENLRFKGIYNGRGWFSSLVQFYQVQNIPSPHWQRPVTGVTK